MIVSDLVKIMKRLAPLERAAEWDNVGLLLGDHQSEVKRVMTCLTLTPDVAKEAISGRVDMIVTHHPLFFRPVKAITTATADGRLVWDLVRAGVAVYSAHTAYDNASGGLNDHLAALLGLSDVEPLRRPQPDAVWGEGRLGTLSEKLPLKALAARVQATFKVKAVDCVGDASRRVGRIALACGAGGELLKDALRQRAEVFITGEMRFHDCLTARTAGLSLCLPGHYGSERVGMEWLATQLKSELAAESGLEVWSSHSESDPLSPV
jgi:dinuclear metal center YbgI/SA1388 family protein